MDSWENLLLGSGMVAMLGGFLYLALRQAKHVTSLFKYHLYGDDLKVNRFAASLISANASLSGAFVLIIYYGYLYGPWAFPFVWSFWLITQRTSEWTISRTAAVMESFGGWSNNRATLHEFLGLVFGSPRARRFAGVLSLLAYLGLMAAEIVLAAHLIGFMFPEAGKMPYSAVSSGAFIVVIALMFFILVYNVLSGFRGTVQTDFAQWIIMSVMVGVVLCFAVAKASYISHDYPRVFSSLNDGIVAAVLNPDKQGWRVASAHFEYGSFARTRIAYGAYR